MAEKYVNLDALIPRADVYAGPSLVDVDSPGFRVTDLEPGITYDMLRKPDFQRETANWKPDQIRLLIETFCKSDIIPAVIIWQNGNRLFVVDGAHRLSALIAWIRHDYGAGLVSQKFFQGHISERQKAMHEITAKLIENSVGTWADFKTANPTISLKEVRIQWIRDYTPEQAAEAFIRINRGGTTIEPLEERILRAKKSALAVATRVISHGGKGHAYWQHFKAETAKTRTPKLGGEIYDLLFHPPLQSPIKSLDVPLAGEGYGFGVVRLVFDLVALANNLPVPDSTRSKAPGEKLDDDTNGGDTVKYLLKTKKVVQLLLSDDPSSLGLHPALYFYTARGAFQPATLLNFVAWMMELDDTPKLHIFRKNRGAFEELIAAHPVIIKPATHTLGSGRRTRSRMIALLHRALDLVATKQDTNTIWETLKAEFDHLAPDQADEDEVMAAGKPGAKFSKETKNAASLLDLSLVPKCVLCGGLKHPNGITLDHAKKKADGGSSALNNARWVHPICNSNRDKDEKANAV
ncbi:MAG: DUF262 domain-containing protein [Mesorhizobium sp.]|nr:MAG: DUF262 domain-containing protein [Mesorhizobium sp.]